MEELLKKTLYTNGLYHVKDSPFEVYIPELLLTNSNDNTLLLTDVFIRICQDTGNFMFKRLSRTHLEDTQEYVHSHCSSTCIGDYTSFCTGGSPYRTLFNRFKKSHKELDFILYWNSVMQLISYESLSGGPYKKIEEFLPYKEATLRRSINEDNIIRENYISYKFKGTGIQSYYKVEDIENPLYICNEIDGVAYSTISDYIPNKTTRLLELDSVIVTNGIEERKVVPRLLPDKELIKGEKKLVINPLVKKQIDEYVTKRVKRLHTIDRLRANFPIDYRKPCFKADKTLLC